MGPGPRRGVRADPDAETSANSKDATSKDHRHSRVGRGPEQWPQTKTRNNDHAYYIYIYRKIIKEGWKIQKK